MIVKNEAENIAECIRSVKPVVDEIIVVDTGSTDDTRTIAEGLEAKVFDFPWCDDFAAARNESIRHATGDYILWLDADDRISHEDRQGLKRLKERLPSSGNPACMLRILNRKTDGEAAVNYQLRIFPNVKGACFEGCVHEQIIPSLNRLGIKVVEEDVHILHTGYEDEEAIKAKAERNLHILLNASKERDRTPSENYHLAQSYFGIEDYSRCIKCLETAMAGGKKESFYKSSFSMAANCHLQLGEDNLAVKNLRQGVAEFPDSGFLHYVLGAALTQSERYEEAIPCLRKAAELGIEIEGHPVLLSVKSLHPYYYGKSLEGIGRLEEAADAYKSALKAAPGNVDTLRALGFLMSKLGKFEDAMNFLKKAKENARDVEKGIWLALAKLYLFFKKSKEALNLYSELLEKYPKDVDSLVGMAKAGIETGDADYLVFAFKGLMKSLGILINVEISSLAGMAILA
ncbi:MAG: glycosyltransferase, partial [Spirochaetales bacterium]|nr:glycosyltransferase [Spirochaetales bacterium]